MEERSKLKEVEMEGPEQANGDGLDYSYQSPRRINNPCRCS